MKLILWILNFLTYFLTLLVIIFKETLYKINIWWELIIFSIIIVPLPIILTYYGYNLYSMILNINKNYLNRN